jgi:hypothetical protein
LGGHLLVGDQLGDDSHGIDLHRPLPQPGYVEEVGIDGDDSVGQLSQAPTHRALRITGTLEPHATVLQTVGQPRLQRDGLQLVPRFAGPAPLVLGPLHQGDVAVAPDQVDSALREVAVPPRPVSGQLGDRRRPVAGEPRRLHLACLHLAGQHDLEGPLTELERWRREIGGDGQRLVGEPIEVQARPVQLLLGGDHLGEDPLGLYMGSIESGPGGGDGRCCRRRLVRGEVATVVMLASHHRFWASHHRCRSTAALPSTMSMIMGRSRSTRPVA